MVLPDRNEKGQFKKGNQGGPGRPPREAEQEYRNIFISSVSKQDWQDIILRAVRDAKRGDHQARKFIADYLIGPPIERKEVTGQDGQALRILVEYASNDSDEFSEPGNY